MSLDPNVAAFLARAQERMGHLSPVTLGIPEFRRQSELLGAELTKEVAEPGPEVGSITEVDAAGVPVKIYRPETPGPHGLYIILHGGGWWQGSVEDWISDVQARERCIGADCVVAAVEYRLAPEHPFPAGLEDCYAAFTWLRDNAGGFGADPQRIVLGGVSAGGNLAAALTLLLRERNQPQPDFAIFEAGVMDLSLDYATYTEYGSGFGLDAPVMAQLLAMYVPGDSERADPLMSPIRAESLAGLAPAHIMTCEFDPTRGTSDAYAARLAEAGVPVTTSEYAGHIHQSPGLTKMLPSARAWRDEVHRVVGAALRSEVAVSA